MLRLDRNRLSLFEGNRRRISGSEGQPLCLCGVPLIMGREGFRLVELSGSERARPSRIQGVADGDATGITMTVSILSRRQRCTLA
jgi:hypothetical protein